MVGTPLLQRRREGVQLTEAGSVLEESGPCCRASITG
jgi:DNA-binding transcriptional LysR family regulator